MAPSELQPAAEPVRSAVWDLLLAWMVAFVWLLVVSQRLLPQPALVLTLSGSGWMIVVMMM